MSKKQPVTNENATMLINKLVDFYQQYPEYETGILEIMMLSRIVAKEMEKFIHRPHTQVTKIFFDKEPTTNMGFV